MTPQSAAAKLPVAWFVPVLTIAGLYVLPVALLAGNVIPLELRFHVLVLVALLASVTAWSRRQSAESLGFAVPGFGQLAMWLAVQLVVLAAGLMMSSLAHRQVAPKGLGFYLFFVFVSAPVQEFLYRSFLFVELSKLGVPRVGFALLSALLYGLMHVVGGDMVTVVLTFCMGLVWALGYSARRNVLLAAASHAVLGASAIRLGFI